MAHKLYTDRSNARRAAKKYGCAPEAMLILPIGSKFTFYAKSYMVPVGGDGWWDGEVRIIESEAVNKAFLAWGIYDGHPDEQVLVGEFRTDATGADLWEHDQIIGHAQATILRHRERQAAQPADDVADGLGDSPNGGIMPDLQAIYDGIKDGNMRATEARLTALAEAGIMPPDPDFSAATHKSHAKRFREVIAMIHERRINEAEKWAPHRANSSSLAMLNRWRIAALRALEVQAAS